MPEGIITTRSVRQSLNGRAVEVVAKLDAGEVVPGMFIHIPMNGMLNFTVRIEEVTPEADGCLRLVLDCGNDPEDAKLVMAFNFEDETLQVLETGEE
jgi:hypothetical protein